MPSDRLTNTEESLIRFAIQRYDRPFFRWGHYLGWLLIPLVALNFVPAVKRYTLWTNDAAILCMFSWYCALATRVIGKLAIRLDLAGVNPPNSETQESNETQKSHEAHPHSKAYRYEPRAVQGTALVFSALLPVAAAIAFKDSGTPPRLHYFLISVCGVEFMLGIFAGLALIAAGYLIYFTGHRLFGTRLFQIGFYVAGLSFAAGIVYGPVIMHLMHY